MDSEFIKIGQKNNLTLEASQIEDGSMRVRVVVLQAGVTVRMLGATVDEQMLARCPLSGLADFREYLLQSEEHYQINLESKSLTVLAMTKVLNNVSYVELLKIALEDIEMKEQQAGNLEHELSRCRSGKELANWEIREILAKLITVVQNRKDNQNHDNTNSEVLDTIITKVMTVGSKNEHLQSRLNKELESLKLQISQINTPQLKPQLQKLKLELQENKTMFANFADRIWRQFEDIKLESEEHRFRCRQMKDQAIGMAQEACYKMEENIKMCEEMVKEVREQMMKKLMEADQEQNRFRAKFLAQDGILVKMEARMNQLEEAMKKRGVQRVEQVSPVKNEPESFSQLFTIPNQDKHKYRVEKTKVERIGSQAQSNGIHGTLGIEKRNSYQFKIGKTDAWGISIGIKDMKNNEIIKYGGNGWISNCSNTIYSQGKGLSTGDIVRLTVDVGKNEVRWEVENKGNKYSYETKCYNAKISGKDRQWVPFMTVSLGDVVELI